jgi:hypothetical protein
MTGGRRYSRHWASIEQKLIDVVGVYLKPPALAVVFSFDEKTQCQALDRTQPSLPMKPGAGRNHDTRLQAARANTSAAVWPLRRWSCT